MRKGMPVICARMSASRRALSVSIRFSSISKMAGNAYAPEAQELLVGIAALVVDQSLHDAMRVRVTKVQTTEGEEAIPVVECRVGLCRRAFATCHRGRRRREHLERGVANGGRAPSQPREQRGERGSSAPEQALTCHRGGSGGAQLLEIVERPNAGVSHSRVPEHRHVPRERARERNASALCGLDGTPPIVRAGDVEGYEHHDADCQRGSGDEQRFAQDRTNHPCRNVRRNPSCAYCAAQRRGPIPTLDYATRLNP